VSSLDDGIGKLEDLFLVTTLSLVTVLVMAGVVLRYVFNDPLTWGEEVIVGVFTWTVFVGAAAAVRSHMHIRIDVLATLYANPKMSWLNVVSLLIGISIVCTMFVACVAQVGQEMVVELPMTGLSKGWVIAGAPVGMALIVLHLLRLWLEQGAAIAFRGETETVIEEATK
jgi:TRAP-type C4-dicarboxylate transport system permease small subunit